MLYSVWRPRYQLIVTLILLAILEYYFAIIIYYFLHEDFIVGEKDICGKLISCYSMILDLTFRANGGFTGFWIYKPE